MKPFGCERRETSHTSVNGNWHSDFDSVRWKLIWKRSGQTEGQNITSDLYARKTKIICTIGPATCTKEALFALADKGMNVARLNMSHGTHEWHLNVGSSIGAQKKQQPSPLHFFHTLRNEKEWCLQRFQWVYVEAGDQPSQGVQRAWSQHSIHYAGYQRAGSKNRVRCPFICGLKTIHVPMLTLA